MHSSASDSNLRSLHHRLANVFAVAVFLQLLTLVVSLPAFGQADSDFDATVFEVDIQRDQCEALLFGTLGEFMQLAFVKQQFARARGLVIHQVGLRVLIDVGPDQPQLATANARVGFLQRDFAIADAFYFAAKQGYAAFQVVEDVVVEPCLAIFADVLRIRILGRLLFLLL